MLSGQEVVILCLFCSVYISWGLTDSIQAPFYPIEAESKGADISEYGLVFGIIHLAIFVSGPIFGKHMHRFGVKNVYIFGVISTGVCALLFGFLDFVDNKVYFLTYSYLLRVLEGVAEAASWSAVFAMLLQMFPQNVATVYSFTEASFSFSEMIGPTLGAFLYELGGFVLPFELCGVLCLVSGLSTILIIPSDPLKVNRHPADEERIPLHSDSIIAAKTDADGNAEAAGNGSAHRHSGDATGANHSQHGSAQIMPVLKNPHVILALSGTVYAAAVQGLLEACLEHYLESFSLSITKIGLTFLALSVPYFLASPLWGYFCDHHFAPEYIQAVGTSIICVGFVILAPVPYFPSGPSYPLTVCGLAFLGIGTAAGLVASFSGAQKAALADAVLPPADVYPAISGIWTSSFALGNFIGPSVGGFLFGYIGFSSTTLVFQAVGFLLLAVDVFKIWRSRRRRMVEQDGRKRNGHHAGEAVLRRVSSGKSDLYERLE